MKFFMWPHLILELIEMLKTVFNEMETAEIGLTGRLKKNKNSKLLTIKFICYLVFNFTPRPKIVCFFCSKV